MFCCKCGKEINGEAAYCPQCGASQSLVTPPPVVDEKKESGIGNSATVQNAPYNTMCIIGLVVSGISLLLNFWGLVGIAGTVLSVLGLSSCKQKKENGKILAIIGIVIGVFSIFYGMLVLVSL